MYIFIINNLNKNEFCFNPLYSKEREKKKFEIEIMLGSSIYTEFNYE